MHQAFAFIRFPAKSAFSAFKWLSQPINGRRSHFLFYLVGISRTVTE